MKHIYYLKKIVSYLTSMLVLSIALNGCKPLSGSPKGERKNSSSQPIPKRVIFILNGLWQYIDTFDYVIQSLADSFESEGIEVIIRKLPETATSNKSITQQAIDAFEKIKSKLAHENHEIILLGHSQGGLRGAQILSLNEQEGNPLTIKGLITLSTPWEGAPAASITKTSIQSFVQRRSVSYMLAGVTYLYPPTVQLTNGTVYNLFDQYFPTHEPGVVDLVPNSDFLRELAVTLTGNSVPILALAANNNDVERFIPEDGGQGGSYVDYIRKMPSGFFNKLYGRIVVGDWNAEHDLMVPLYSQIAHNTNKNSTFQSHIINDAVHDFLPGLSIPLEQVIYNHPETIRMIVGFAKQNFSLIGTKDTCCLC